MPVLDRTPNRPPVGTDTHSRITDINYRLRDVRNVLGRTLDRLRADSGEGEASNKATVISHTVISKLDDTSSVVSELEALAGEFEQRIGSAEEDVAKPGISRAS